MAINDGVELVASWLTPTVLFCVMNVMIGTIFFRSSLRPRTKQQLKDEQPPHSPRQLGPNPSFFHRVRSFNMSNYDTPQPDPVHNSAEQPSNPSFFERVKSFNMSSYQTQQPDPVHHAEPVHEPAARQREEIHHHAVPAHEPPPRQREEIHHDAVPAREPAARWREEILRAIAAEEAAARQEEEIHDAAEEAAARQIHRATEETRHHVRTRSDVPVKAAPAAKVLLKSVSELVLTEEEEEERWRPATARERGSAEQEEEEVDGKADDFINKFRQQLKLQRLDSLVRYNDMINRGAGRWR